MLSGSGVRGCVAERSGTSILFDCKLKAPPRRRFGVIYPDFACPFLQVAARTPLHEAAGHGRLLEVETLLSGVGRLGILYEERLE